MTICYPSTTDWGCAPESYVDGLADNVKTRSEALAWTTLRTLLGGSLAICPVIVRPCALRCEPNLYVEAPVVGGRRYGAYIGADGAWYNGCGCPNRTFCACARLQEVHLEGPVGRVVSVLVDGDELEPTQYRVDNGNLLVRTDGQPWPACQDLSLADTEPGTFSVEYFRGGAPDEMDDWAAGVLAYEFAKACNDDECRLPEGVVSVTRAGVSMQIATGLFTDGKTGIRELDAYLFTRNPYGLRQPSTVMSPETLARTPRMQTWGS